MHFFRSLCGICNFAYHLLGVYFRLVVNVWRLSGLEKPVVSVFGGAKLEQKSEYAKKAGSLAAKLIEHGVTVITGGGPGIMQAANCGAFEHRKDSRGKSIGISVRGLSQEEVNGCLDILIVMKHFPTRKYLLTNFSTAFAIFPGGYGTIDELFEILTLMQTSKIPRVPVVLIEKHYWQPVIEWAENAVKEGLLLQSDRDLIFVTNDIEEAFTHLHEHCERQQEV